MSILRHGIATARRWATSWERRWLDPELSATGAPADGLRRARVLLWAISMVPLGLATTQVVSLALGKPLVWLELGVTTSMLAVVGLLPLLRRRRRVARAGFLLVTGLCLGSLLQVAGSAGQELVAAMMLTVLPALATVVLGLRGAVFTCSLIVVGLTATGVAVEIGALVPAQRVPAAVFDRWLFAVPVLVTLASTAIVTLLEASRRRALAELEASRAELAESEAQIRQLAFYDEVTGLGNRAFILERLDAALGAARTHDHAVGLFFLDLDGFKDVNDTLGHEAGDEILAEVAQRFSSCLRLSDRMGHRGDEFHLSRFGGDEFVVLLARVNGRDGCEIVARRLIASLEEPLRIRGRKRDLGVSLGIAVYPEDGENAGTLLRRADHAMYRAKRVDGSAYRFHDADA